MNHIVVPTDGIAPPEDINAVTQSCLDYAEGWYNADAERMQRCLHPDLVKRTLMRDPQAGSWILRRPANAEMMVAFTQQGGGSVVPESQRVYEVIIYDVFRHVACARVVTAEYVDYVQLAKFDQHWLIVNVLWELREEEVGPNA
jgi:hypothetical protein